MAGVCQAVLSLLPATSLEAFCQARGAQVRALEVDVLESAQSAPVTHTPNRYKLDVLARDDDGVTFPLGTHYEACS